MFAKFKARHWRKQGTGGFIPYALLDEFLGFVRRHSDLIPDEQRFNLQLFDWKRAVTVVDRFTGGEIKSFAEVATISWTAAERRSALAKGWRTIYTGMQHAPFNPIVPPALPPSGEQ